MSDVGTTDLKNIVTGETTQRARTLYTF